jgi:hypothetical protein
MKLKETTPLGDGQPSMRILTPLPGQTTSEFLSLMAGQGIQVFLRDATTGELIQYGRTNNLILNVAKATLLQRLFGVSGSSRTISQIAVGEGTTAPTAGDTALEDQITFKAIASVNQAGEASVPPSRICIVTFGSSEANGAGTTYIREVGFLFDNNSIVTRASFAQGTITGATQANPVVITSAGCQAKIVAAGGGNGSQVFIEGVAGMTQINDLHFTVAGLATNSFELSGVNGTGYGAFSASSPETAKWTLEFEKNSSRVLEISYPFGLTE